MTHLAPRASPGRPVGPGKRQADSMASRALAELAKLPQPVSKRDMQRVLLLVTDSKAQAASLRNDLTKRGYIDTVVFLTPAGASAIERAA